MCHDAEILLKYLSSYSSDLNPIETSFSVLKTWIKRHQDLVVLYFDEGRYGDFLDLAVHAQEDRYDAGNLFRKSGIYYRSQDEMDAVEKTLNEWIRYFMGVYVHKGLCNYFIVQPFSSSYSSSSKFRRCRSGDFGSLSLKDDDVIVWWDLIMSLRLNVLKAGVAGTSFLAWRNPEGWFMIDSPI